LRRSRATAVRRFVRAIVAPQDEPRDPDEPVAILHNLFEAEAEMMRGRLEAEGIRSFVRGLRPDPLFGRINVELCVRSGDAERAREVLGE
jgi:hypothetical protein